MCCRPRGGHGGWVASEPWTPAPMQVALPRELTPEATWRQAQEGFLEAVASRPGLTAPQMPAPKASGPPAFEQQHWRWRGTHYLSVLV